MNTAAKIIKLQNEAFERGFARDGAVTVRRFPQRRDHAHLTHVSPYRYLFYINGNRVPCADAARFLAD